MTRIMMRMGLVGLTCCCFASVAVAIPIEVHLVPVDNSAGGPELEGFTTTDIVLTIPGTHTGSQLFVELERGTIYQHPLGTELAPNPPAVELFPALAYDTYVAYGDHVGTPWGSYGAKGAAVNLDQSVLPRPLTFGESLLDVAWGPSAGGSLPHETDHFLAARITLSDDARGRWLYLASSVDEFTIIAPDDASVYSGNTPVISAGTGLIRTGDLRIMTEIPEPATLGLAVPLLVGATLVGRRARPGPIGRAKPRPPSGGRFYRPNPAQDLRGGALAKSASRAIY